MRFNARVNHEVLLQMSQLFEGLSTGITIFVFHVTAVWSHLSVCSKVHPQIAELAKPFGTFRTLVNHFPINFLTSDHTFLFLDH